LTLPGISPAMPEHCVVTGRLNERKSPVDGKDYAIGSGTGLPTQRHGRLLYQANGSLEGFATPAYGNILGGGPTTNGLLKGLTVISAHAGAPSGGTTGRSVRRCSAWTPRRAWIPATTPWRS
jgi:feruloyl esterase